MIGDENKLREFAQRVCRRAITNGGPDDLDVDPGVYVKVAVGTSRQRSVTVGKIEAVQDRDPAEVVDAIRSILAGAVDGDEPRAYVQAVRHGHNNPHDSVILNLVSEDDPALPARGGPPGKTLEDHLTVLVHAVERMSRDQGQRADVLAHELARARERAFEADFTQTWVWDPNLSSWMVADWTVQPFAPRP